MNLAEHLPVLAIAIPLAGASITFVIGGRRLLSPDSSSRP